jgi:hypothetical protein
MRQSFDMSLSSFSKKKQRKIIYLLQRVKVFGLKLCFDEET